MFEYHDIPASQLPQHLRFDVPRRNQGQIVEVAYADWPTEAGETGPGARFRRTTDTSTMGPGRVTYAMEARAHDLWCVRDFFEHQQMYAQAFCIGERLPGGDETTASRLAWAALRAAAKAGKVPTGDEPHLGNARVTVEYGYPGSTRTVLLWRPDCVGRAS